MNTRYVNRHEINDEKWDECIKNSTKPFIYAISWYLDAATNKQWDAIIWGDYNAVMPLPWNRKLLTKQVYMPYAIKQLGVFHKASFSPDLEKTLKQLTKKFAAVNYHFHNPLPHLPKRPNQEFSLSKPKEKLIQQFRSDRRRDLRKFDDVLIKTVTVNEYMEVFNSFFTFNLKDKKSIYNQFFNAYKAAEERQKFLGFKALFEGKTLSAIGCIQGLNRIHLLSSANSKLGYSQKTNVKLRYTIIEQFANTNTVLDFMGSNIEGVNNFNASFGATEEYYYIYNKQQSWVNILKRILNK